MKGKIFRKLGRQGTVVLALMSVAVLVVSAGLIGTYSTVTTTAQNVQSALTFDGQPLTADVTNTITDPMAGCTYCFCHNFENRACSDAEVTWSSEFTQGDEDDVDISLYTLPKKTVLELENKDADWVVISDTTQATLEFYTVYNEFNYSFEATGLQATTNYDLIYYADEDPRFNVWGGDNPGAYIATFTTDGSGNIAYTEDSIDLDMSMPAEPDWNIDPDPNYCDYNNTFDDYDHCHGAKIWLVPSVDYDDVDCEVTNWNPTTFLFETDLVVYIDCDSYEEYENVPFYMMDDKIELTDPFTVEEDSMFYLFICYAFDINIVNSPSYTMVTTFGPAP